MGLDTLNSREHHIALYERYGPLLSGRRREVLDLYLREDWSLSEIANHLHNSRAAVHDVVRQSIGALEDYEGRLGLIAEEQRRRDERTRLARELALLRRRVSRLESRLGEAG